jgi:hypothetical protein
MGGDAEPVKDVMQVVVKTAAQVLTNARLLVDSAWMAVGVTRVAQDVGFSPKVAVVAGATMGASVFLTDENIKENVKKGLRHLIDVGNMNPPEDSREKPPSLLLGETFAGDGVQPPSRSLRKTETSTSSVDAVPQSFGGSPSEGDLSENVGSETPGILRTSVFKDFNFIPRHGIFF